MFHLQFILQNIHFTLHVLAAFVFFAVFWLHFDAWLTKKTTQDLIKIFGFFSVSISFIASAVSLEQSLLPQVVFGHVFVEILAIVLRLVGYVLIMVGLILDPLQKKPDYSKIKSEFITLSFTLPQTLPLLPQLMVPFLSLIISGLYWRRATSGLERHLKPISFGFFVLSLFEALSLVSLLRNTLQVSLFNLAAPFGPVWIAEHVSLLIALLVIGKWVFHYLIRRIQTQLFMLFTTFIMMIFLITTVTFTTLLLQNLSSDALQHLESDVAVLQYIIDSKKAELLADAEVVAQNSQIQQAVQAKDSKKLSEITTSILLAKKQNSLVVLSQEGQVLARAEDPERIGDSLSEDVLVKQALQGQAVSSVIVKNGIVTPEVIIRSATPIQSEKGIIGTAVVSSVIDNTFVDGVKAATGLDAAVYAGDTRSATTFVTEDGKSRAIGISEKHPEITDTVLTKGEHFVGPLKVLNVTYLAAFTPLQDREGKTIGMLFVGKEQRTLLETAARSVEFTFIVSAILLVFSVIPAFVVARNLTYQMK